MKAINGFAPGEAIAQSRGHSRSLVFVSAAALTAGVTISYWKMRRLAKFREVEAKYEGVTLF
jgi:hypothetical protein